MFSRKYPVLLIWWCVGCLLSASACRSQSGRQDLALRIARRELVTALNGPPLTLDPRGLTNTETAHLQQLIYSTLLKKGSDFSLVPDLAKSWDMDPGARTLTVKLRPQLSFHDGRTCTARDVAFTFTSLIQGHYGKASAFSRLEKVFAADDLTVVFTCSESNPGLPVDLVAVGIVPAGSGPEMAETPIGTGPYQVTEYRPGQWIRLTSFGKYHALLESVEPQPTHLMIRFLPDAATRELELQSGSLDFLLDGELQPATFEQWKTRPGWVVKNFPGGGLVFLTVNTEHGRLGDVRIRQALALSLNRREIIDRVLGGQAGLAYSPLPPGHWAFSDSVAKFDFDPSRACQLLKEAGGHGGYQFQLLIETGAEPRRLGEIFQETWRQVGVDVSIIQVEKQLYLEKIRYGDYDLALGRLSGGNQFTTIFKGAFHSRAIHFRGDSDTGELNYARYRNPQIDSLMDAALAAPFSLDQGRERQKYLMVQEKITEEVPWILLWHPNHNLIARANLEGFCFPPGGGGEVFAQVRWKKQD